jgi:uncharacterized protein
MWCGVIGYHHERPINYVRQHTPPREEFRLTITLDRFYAALKALSAADLAACVSDDFVLNWQGTASIPWAGMWNGVEGLLSFVSALEAHVAILDVQRLHQLQDGVAIAVILRGHWRLKATGREVTAVACNLFTFAGGKIGSYTVINNTAAFAEAMTLRPPSSAA